jgi:hypothetical protein
MKRQAIQVSPKELRKIADELEKEYKEDLPIDVPLDKRAILPIINKTPKCSDTWEFEK